MHFALNNSARLNKFHSLSRSPNTDSTEINLDLQIHHLQFTPQRLDQIKQETRQDRELKQLMETIVVGWPEKRRDVYLNRFSHVGRLETN